MTRYIIHYTVKRWSDYDRVEKILMDCGVVWKHNVSSTLIRLDSELTPMQLQTKMNSVLNLNFEEENFEQGDTYYFTVVSEYRSHCHWTKLQSRI